MIISSSARQVIILSFLCSCFNYSVTAAEIICTIKSGESFTALGFLIGTCNVDDELMPYVNLLTGTFLTVNNSKEVRSILEEYRPHLEALVNGDFCVKVREGTGASLWEQLNPNEFSADEFFNQLLCKHKLIRSYLESQPFPEELKVVSSESMAELRWILDHAEKLYNAINREFRNFRANH